MGLAKLAILRSRFVSNAHNSGVPVSHDRKFFDTFMLIIGALVLFSVAMIVLSEVIGGRTQEAFIAEDPAVIGMIEEQIAPFGTVVVEGDAEPDAPPPVDAVVAVVAPEAEVVTVAAISGEEIYNSACMACHTTGVAGAPKTGDVAAWSERIAKGSEALYANAINGYQGSAGVMPAKGGRVDLSDEAVQAAVDYMVEQSQ